MGILESKLFLFLIVGLDFGHEYSSIVNGSWANETQTLIMTEKTIQLNLTEEQFNMIWNALVLSEDEMVDEGDIRVRVETLNEMEDIMKELGLEVFGDLDDD